MQEGSVEGKNVGAWPKVRLRLLSHRVGWKIEGCLRMELRKLIETQKIRPIKRVRDF